MLKGAELPIVASVEVDLRVQYNSFSSWPELFHSEHCAKNLAVVPSNNDWIEAFFECLKSVSSKFKTILNYCLMSIKL